jgi:hypothetical protein
MFPLDGSSPTDFSGIDFATFVNAPAIYNRKELEDRVAAVLQQFFESRGLPARHCFVGGRGAAAGGPMFLETLQWFRDNWETMEQAATMVLSFVAGMMTRWRLLKRRLNDKVLTPFGPSVVVEVGSRTKGTSPAATAEAHNSFMGLLRLAPELSETLNKELDNVTFSIRVTRLGASTQFLTALFNVARITKTDAVKVIKHFDKRKNDSDVSAVLLYRKFGFYTRLRVA